jgi:biopolymer transport protein ExbB
VVAPPVTAAAPSPGAPAPAAAAPPAPAPALAAGFVGDLDEVEMAKVARAAPFIAAAFASQSPESHMVAYGEDEENSSMSGGYFGVILRSVTIDGWVVIGILGIMFAVALVVMITKAIYVNKTARANRPFLDLFTRYGADFDTLRVQVEAADDHSMDDSILYRVYRAADEELVRRTEASRTGYLVLSPQAIASIRAGLDRVAQQEVEKLNSLLVLLTIAISGGPFLGLLGTVVGVMITFAAIAASGDVNINAIAPGIAAALVATVAGLAVAIPSLFGYNYLTARIKDLTAQMRGFVDELVTRLGETYIGRPERLAAE